MRCTWKNWRGANVVLVRNFLFTLDNQIVLFHLWSAGRNFPCDILEGCLIFMNTYLLISVQYPSHSWKVGIRTLPLLHLVMCICLRSCAWHALAKSICGCLEHPQTPWRSLASKLEISQSWYELRYLWCFKGMTIQSNNPYFVIASIFSSFFCHHPNLPETTLQG